MTVLRFVDDSGIRVGIGREALSLMWQHAQLEPGAIEAGGVLLGRELLTTGDLIVDTVSVPMAGDLGTTTSFFRSARAHQRLILEVWQRSEGTCGYLGEWHTHAEAWPAPSIIDRMEWKRRLVDDVVDARFSLFLVVGTRGLGAWLGDRQRTRVRALGYRELPR